LKRDDGQTDRQTPREVTTVPIMMTTYLTLHNTGAARVMLYVFGQASSWPEQRTG